LGIGHDGAKKLLTGGQKRGHFIIVQGELPADLIVVAEGFATAMTAASQFPGACVLAAIDTGNLKPMPGHSRQNPTQPLHECPATKSPAGETWISYLFYWLLNTEPNPRP
jgi:hypothetical protein